VKLSKLYANKASFEPIVFNSSGINIVLGDVTDGAFSDAGAASHEHNLGKTSLVHLIDFMLLKKIDKKHLFGKRKEKFADWTFYLEIELNNKRYLTIQRSVNPNSKISFKEHIERHQTFNAGTSWDFEDLSLHSQKEDNPLNVLQEYLDFNVADKYGFRSVLPYLLRTQNDYRDVFRLDKFRGADSTWKPPLYEVLGFDSSILETKYEYDSQISDDKKFIKRINSSQESEAVGKIRAAIEAKTRDRQELSAELDQFDFYAKEQGINTDLVKRIEFNIAKLNKEEYRLNYEVQQIRESLAGETAADPNLDDIRTLFNEVGLYFPDKLTKSYEDLVKFKSQLTSERSKYLKDELSELAAELDVVITKLADLNKERSKALMLLKEKDTFIKYKDYQEQLSKLDAEIAFYEAKLENAETVERYEKSLDDTRDKLRQLKNKVKTEISQENPDFKKIKQLFQEIYKSAFGYTALLTIEPNKEANIEVEVTVLNQADDLSGKGDGYTATKVLCSSFGLAILINYRDRSFFRFLYHDGALESWGDNPKTQFIDALRVYTKENDIQYIASIIKSDIPTGFAFTKEEVIRTLNDQNTLFGIDF
jgi:uncharacterized protein YydD (DUF2326 family)